MTFLTISPKVAIDPAITVANPIFQSGIKQAMKNKSPLIGLFTNTGWKAKMIFQFGALAFTKVCILCSKFPPNNDKCLWEKKETKNFARIFFSYTYLRKKPAQIVQLSSSTPIYLSKLKVVWKSSTLLVQPNVVTHWGNVEGILSRNRWEFLQKKVDVISNSQEHKKSNQLNRIKVLSFLKETLIALYAIDRSGIYRPEIISSDTRCVKKWV